MNIIETIKTEIERLKKECCYGTSEFIEAKLIAFNIVLSFLDTLEGFSVKPNNHLEGLEEAAWKYCEFTLNGETFHEEGQYDGFIAGADWAMDRLPKWRESSKEFYTDKPKVYEGFGQFKLFWKDRVIDLNKVFETLPKK